jgi:hypothetical protein
VWTLEDGLKFFPSKQYSTNAQNNAFQQSLSRRLNKGKAENVYQNHTFVIETLLIHHHLQFSKWGG